MKSKNKILKSWRNVFKRKSEVYVANNKVELKAAIELGCTKVIGSLHSYNTAAFADKVVKLDGDFKRINFDIENNTCLVGAAAQIKDVMAVLLKNGRRLINSGNHREQTFVGACITGTHGFGPKATMADQIIYSSGIDDFDYTLHGEPFKPKSFVTQVEIETAPLTQYEITNCICRLSDIKGTQSIQRAFAVLPYSGQDPVIIKAEYKQMEPNLLDYQTEAISIDAPVKEFDIPWKIRLWWEVDKRIPIFRKIVQRTLSFASIKPWKKVTAFDDIDALYHQEAGFDNGSDFKLWAYKPTYTCYNTALFIKPEDTQEVIKFAIEQANKIDKYLLRCFIGIRELTDKSDYELAGNFEGPVNAVDFYCTPKKAQKLIQLQKLIQDKFWTRPHMGKTYL